METTTTEKTEQPEKKHAVLKVLENCFIELTHETHGFIFNDSRGFYKDGTSVITSPVCMIQRGGDADKPVAIITDSGMEYTLEYVNDRDIWMELATIDPTPEREE